MGDAILMGQSGGKKPKTQEKTVTPSASQQVITPDTDKLLSKVTVEGDVDLVASNIKSGVNIFGVTGNVSPMPVSRTIKAYNQNTMTLVNHITATSGGAGVTTITIGMDAKFYFYHVSAYANLQIRLETTYNY